MSDLGVLFRNFFFQPAIRNFFVKDAAFLSAEKLPTKRYIHVGSSFYIPVKRGFHKEISNSRLKEKISHSGKLQRIFEKIWFVVAAVVLGSCLITPAFADDNIVNVYTWSGVIPDFAIQQFEKETGIKVNFSTYDSNETMYAKLRASKNAGYDVIEPSSYYIDRMRRQGMLQQFDKSQLSNLKNINSAFQNQSYDPTSDFSIPFIWGVTGIFVNKDYFDEKTIQKWTDLWDPKYKDQLMFLDDSREMFSMALKSLGYSANDNNPDHIYQAYLKLKALMPNIKLFNSDAVISILIDEDATLGMAWNGDVFKAQQENAKLTFVYPKDGFVVWVDNFAIPKGAPHLSNAYKFLNFMMRADVAKAVAIDNSYPTANLAAEKLLPKEIQTSPIAYPSKETLKKGEFQTDIGDAALALYEKYWEQLKMGG